MRSLEEIATHYGTAKVPHGYMPIYEGFFEPLRSNKISLLEIGVATGASLRTWSKYFESGKIFGIDKHIQFNESIFNQWTTIEGDATKEEDLDFTSRQGPFDIIIDDGSHIANEQLSAFYGLWNALKLGGYYVVEDLFTLFDPVWNPGNPHTIIQEIQNRMGPILVGGDSIQEVHWFGRNDINGILFLRKRNEEFRIQPLEEFKMKENDSNS